MTYTRPGFFLAAALALWVLAAPRVEAACNDKKILAMANDGRTVNAIAKACNMPAAKVRGVIERADADDEAPPPTPKAERAAVPELVKKLPSGAGLASCDCQGMVPYGERAPDLRCQSGMSMATPCAGYCSPHGVAPWRRICS
ncbi:hypothetical protein FOC84_29305 [Achromobacter pestifer]|uniref:Helix-turn-helix domain-containing protein n=1 Tax=Achromobacter pestifer TaxID=1353889 RepID=A0A7D4E401_9BURK|nr:hypothetical protein [Achromobacter pestifer]QKH38809.1 hypothetical protein FOC84_29305 [Achromobacter pestifer]